MQQQWSRSGKKKDRVKLRNHQNCWFSEFHPPLDANVLFSRFFLNLTLCMTKLRVLVLSFPDFTDISDMQRKCLITGLIIDVCLLSFPFFDNFLFGFQEAYIVGVLCRLQESQFLLMRVLGGEISKMDYGVSGEIYYIKCSKVIETRFKLIQTSLCVCSYFQTLYPKFVKR